MQQDKELYTKGIWESKQITKKEIIIGIAGYGTGDNYRKDNKCGLIAHITGWNGESNTELSEEDIANADRIVKCVNGFDEMVMSRSRALVSESDAIMKAAELELQVKELKEALHKLLRSHRGLTFEVNKSLSDSPLEDKCQKLLDNKVAD